MSHNDIDGIIPSEVILSEPTTLQHLVSGVLPLDDADSSEVRRYDAGHNPRPVGCGQWSTAVSDAIWRGIADDSHFVQVVIGQMSARRATRRVLDHFGRVLARP